MKRHPSTPFAHAAFNYNPSGGQRGRAWESFPRSVWLPPCVLPGEEAPGMPGRPGDVGCASCIAHIPSREQLSALPAPSWAVRAPCARAGRDHSLSICGDAALIVLDKATKASLRCVWMDSVRGLSMAWLGMGGDASSSYSLCCWAAPAAPHPRAKQGPERASLSCRAPVGLRDCNPHFQLVPTLVTHTQCCRNGCPGELTQTSDFLATPFSAVAALLGCCA